MRTAAIAFAICPIIVALMSIGTHLLDIERIPESPADGGWPGVLSLGCLVASVVAIARRPLFAGLFASVSGLLYVVANWDDGDLPMIAWIVVFSSLIYLAYRSDTERRTAETRAAIHERIDEEIVDTSAAS